MSAKNAKALRSKLRSERFPVILDQNFARPRGLQKPGYKGEEYQVQINHVRRIRRLMKSTGMPLTQALAHHKHVHKIPHTRTV